MQPPEDATRRRPWLPTALLVGVVYALIGITFAWPTTNGLVWRWAAWLVSGVVWATHAAHEHFRLRNSPRSTALHVALGVAVGAIGLVVGAVIHDWMTASSIRRAWLLAIVLWPAITAVPAFLVTLGVSTVLARLPRRADT